MGPTKIVTAAVALVLCFSASMPVNAQFRSPNYKAEETFFGTGGAVDMSSPSYRARQAVGALGVGAVSSDNYDAQLGFVTDNVPFLEMTVSGAKVELGALSDTTTSFGAATGGPCGCSFTVRSYLSSEYVVITMSTPPTSENGAVLTSKAVRGVPSTDQTVEEFGMNLVDNTAPNIGASPLNVPDSTFADGGAAADYDVPDQFKFAQGDIIARAAITPGNPAIGQTNYTISYIAKRKPLSEAGLYTMLHDIVVVATF